MSSSAPLTQQPCSSAPPRPSAASDASIVTHDIQDRLLTKFRYLTDFLDLGLQYAACRWLFVEKDNVLRMLVEFWPDLFVILLVCSLVPFDNHKFGIFVATPLTLGLTAFTLFLASTGAPCYFLFLLFVLG